MNGKISKDDSLFFDMLTQALEKGDRKTADKVQVALNAFMLKPKKLITKQIQAVGVSTDFARLTKDAYNVTIEEDNFDLGYQRAFRDVTVGKGQDSWEIYTVTDGLTFRKIPEGGRIRVEGLTGEKITAYVDKYGGALGWTDEMIRFRKIAAMVDMAMIFRNNFWLNKANNHYALLAAATLVNPVLAWQGVAADGQLRRDIQTINEAAFQLSNANKDKGYGDTANVRMILYANPRDKARINAAFRATTNQTLGAGNSTVGTELEWNIDVIYTFNASIVARQPVLVLPRNKIQKADVMQPTTFTQPKDPLTLNELQAVWAYYGAVIADTDQVKKLTLG